MKMSKALMSITTSWGYYGGIIQDYVMLQVCGPAKHCT